MGGDIAHAWCCAGWWGNPPQMNLRKCDCGALAALEQRPATRIEDQRDEQLAAQVGAARRQSLRNVPEWESYPPCPFCGYKHPVSEHF